MHHNSYDNLIFRTRTIYDITSDAGWSKSVYTYNYLPNLYSGSKLETGGL